jgi:hypothetical protein
MNLLFLTPVILQCGNGLHGRYVCSARGRDNEKQNLKEMNMRRLIMAAAATAITAGALATPAMAQVDDRYPQEVTYGAPVVGAAVGTAAGVGLYNGWYGTSAAATSLGATAGAAAVAGGVAGVGTIVLIDSVAQPCRGFNAVFGLNKDACVNGQYVGYRQAPHPRRMR